MSGPVFPLAADEHQTLHDALCEIEGLPPHHTHVTGDHYGVSIFIMASPVTAITMAPQEKIKDSAPT